MSLRVFISSTSRDLESYRTAVAEVVLDAGWQPDMMEHFPAGPERVVALCQRRVGEADLLILLQAFRKGGVPSHEQGGDGEASYTALELRAADLCGKPVIAFFADDRWPGSLYEEDASARAWVIDFRNKVNRNGKFFGPEDGDLREFRSLLREAIAEYRTQLLNRQSLGKLDDLNAAWRQVALRTPSSLKWPAEPYPLLHPYVHPDTFAGREAELLKLDILVRRPQLVLCLYASSGVGKSSLLQAGLVPRLRAAGFPVSLERRPGEPGLARRLLSDICTLPSKLELDDNDPHLFDNFAGLVDRVGGLAGKPPILILDQVDDFLRQADRGDEALARLGPLMAVTARRLPGGHEFSCRWLLCYRHEFHGEIAEWLRDVLNQARRARRNGLEDLPHNLSDGERMQQPWPIPLMGAPQPGEAPGNTATRAFLAAITRPLELRKSAEEFRYEISIADTGAERLAQAFSKARTKQPHAPLVPELQVVLRHLLNRATRAPSGVLTIEVPDDPVALEALIDDALASHLRQALEDVFPLGRDSAKALQGRSRALLVLRELADDSGRRGKGLPREEVVSSLGPDGESVLSTLESPGMRLVVEETRGNRLLCMLAHDRMAEVIVQFVDDPDVSVTLEHDRAIVDLRRFVSLRSDLYGGNDDTALSLTAEQHSLVAANAVTLLRSAEQRQWWQESDTWFSFTERLRGNPYSGFEALLELSRRDDISSARLLDRLRAANVSPQVFWDGAWKSAARDPVEVLQVVERTHLAFQQPIEMLRAISCVVEEALWRQPDLLARVELCRQMRAQGYAPAATAQVPLFRGDRWFLPDEPLLGLVEIPAGRFRMGSMPSESSSGFDDEGWASSTPNDGTLDLSTFYLSRYAVTVAQFRAFLESTRYRLANDAGLDRNPEHPMVAVSWHEAIEYCRWLQRTLTESRTVPDALKQLFSTGFCVSLPSEAEWEKAARGRDARTYPWGETIDATRANYAEARLLGTTIVGAYPAGASAYGILDMGGNTWEWTRSLFRPYPYDPADGRESSDEPGARVVRGGAFRSYEGHLRSAFRGISDQATGYHDVGFRFACIMPRGGD